jgi:hypothetical protein
VGYVGKESIVGQEIADAAGDCGSINPGWVKDLEKTSTARGALPKSSRKRSNLSGSRFAVGIRTVRLDISPFSRDLRRVKSSWTALQYNFFFSTSAWKRIVGCCICRAKYCAAPVSSFCDMNSPSAEYFVTLELFNWAGNRKPVDVPSRNISTMNSHP